MKLQKREERNVFWGKFSNGKEPTVEKVGGIYSAFLEKNKISTSFFRGKCYTECVWILPPGAALLGG